MILRCVGISFMLMLTSLYHHPLLHLIHAASCMCFSKSPVSVCIHSCPLDVSFLQRDKKYCSSESLWDRSILLNCFKTRNQALRAKLCTCMLFYCNLFIFCKRKNVLVDSVQVQMFSIHLYGCRPTFLKIKTSTLDSLYSEDTPCANLLL